MKLKFCPECGEKLVRISSKTSTYKAVCRSCELTYKVLDVNGLGEVIKLAATTPSQITEAAICGHV